MHGQWDTNVMTPSALTQLARDRLSSSLVIAPVEFDLDDFSFVLGSHSTILADIP
jgi:hypothetical protein